jgi:gentisate 1,2-dioxygenase
MAGMPGITLDELPELYQDLERQHLVPLWEIAPRLLPREPQPQAIPYLWRWADIVPLTHPSAKLIPIERGGERRVIAFMPPGFWGQMGGNLCAVGRSADSPARRTRSGAPAFTRRHSLHHPR